MQHQSADHCVVQAKSRRTSNKNILFAFHDIRDDRFKFSVLKIGNTLHQHIIYLLSAHLACGHKLRKVIVIAVRRRAYLLDPELIPAVILLHGAAHFNDHFLLKHISGVIIPELCRHFAVLIPDHQIKIGRAVFGLLYLALFYKHKAVAHTVLKLFEIHTIYLLFHIYESIIY